MIPRQKRGIFFDMTSHELYPYFKNSTGISIDTRTVENGNLFFALKGDNFDGNLYADKALAAGASYAVIDDSNKLGPNCILVEDCLKSLQDLARYHRESLGKGIKIFGLTGSNGKTTTKELIYEILKTQFKVKATIGNLNNHIGVPLTLLRFQEEDEIGIVEMGANHQKEIEFLCSICKPDIGYITNFGKAHLEGFGGIEGVIKGKRELYTFLKENKGLVLLNNDDPIQKRESLGIQNILFGKQNTEQLDYLIEENEDIELNNPYVSLKLKGEKIQSNLTGQYNFNNISAAIAIGLFLKISEENIKAALESYKPSNNRSQIENTKRNQLIIDAYNANPSSMEGAILNLLALKAEEKWMILGDMFELGDYEAEEHKKVVLLAAKQNFEKLIFVGEAFSKCEMKLENQITFKTTDNLLHFLEEEKPKGKTILIKGSRGMKLERCIPLL